MAEKTNKSHFTQKQSNKEEKPTVDELKLRRLDDFVQKLYLAVEHKEKYERNTHKELSKQKVNNKSNYSSPTTSRIKEDISDREFLSNFMNMDEHTTIIPKNMHLLTDNDTNQSISPQEKFKNLSNLMIDDKNITEYNFIRDSEERVKLNLYMAFSKKSRDLFIKENDPKRAKNQTLFHKINDIHIPKFDFKPTSIPSSNNDSKFYNSVIDQSDANLEKSMGSDSINNITNSFSPYEKNVNNDEEKNNNNTSNNTNIYEENKFKECYFRQEKKGYFHIPTLVKIENKHKKKEFRKQKTYLGATKMFNPFKKEIKKTDDNFWDPEIDADTLSYINHNFISIEDIYNSKGDEEKKGKNNNLHNEENEPNLIPIQAKEITLNNNEEIIGAYNFIFDKDKNNEDQLKFGNRTNNKFIEFIEINPGVIRSEYPVGENSNFEMKFESNLKKDFREKINKISEIDHRLFPRNASLSPQKIERILRFQRLVKITKNEINLTIYPKSSTDDSENKTKEEIIVENDNENEKSQNLKEKTSSENDENKSSIKEEEDEFYSKNSISLNSQNDPANKSDQKNVFNFNEENSERSPFSSEKS